MISFIRNLVTRWLHEDQGVTAVEYAVMLALIIVVLVGTINTLGGSTLAYFDNSVDEIGKAMAEAGS